MVSVAYCPHEQGNATDRRARDKADRTVDTERRLADADLRNLRWHASTLILVSLGFAARLSSSLITRSVAEGRLQSAIPRAERATAIALSAISRRLLGEDIGSRV